jgi:murein DD-endopeptidase MepM/ murein hydrolase activator NlpD
MGIREQLKQFTQNSQNKWIPGIKIGQNKVLKPLTAWSKDRIEAFRLSVQEHKKGWKIAAVTGAIVVVSTVSGFTYYEANMNNLYAVSYRGQMMGYVADPDDVKKWLAELEKKKEDEYNQSVKLVLSEDIKYESVRLFKGEAETRAVLDKLAGRISMKALATQVVINGKPVGIVADAATAQALIDQYKSKFVPEQARLNERTPDNRITAASTMASLPSKNRVKIAALSSDSKTQEDKNQDQIESVSVKEDVQFDTVLVDPDQIMDPDSLMELISKGTLQEQTYRIQEGDTLSEVAEKFNMTTKELLAINTGLSENDLLQIGQVLNVTKPTPLLSVITKEKVNKQVKVPYETEVRKDDSMFKGDKKVIQQGEKGLKAVSLEIIKENGVEQKKVVLSETMINEPVPEIVLEGTKVIPSRGTGDMLWPARGGGIITSPFGTRWGAMHKGIDISGVTDRAVVAADNGTIETAGWLNGYGYAVIINHNNGLQTLYGHMSKLLVRSGQIVARGQQIGVMGSTGNSTGVHLHFEVRRNGSCQNPVQYVSR